MTTHISFPKCKLNHPTYSTLPLEIRHEILSHLLIESSKIVFRSESGFKAANCQDTPQCLPYIDIEPGSRTIFYRVNIFDVSAENLVAFLHNNPSTTPPTTIPAKSSKEYPMVKDLVRNLIVGLGPYHPTLEPWTFDPVPALRSLMECPHLETVELHIGALFEGIQEFRTTFMHIKGVCMELGERFGEEGFRVQIRSLYTTVWVTMADFRCATIPMLESDLYW
ncbi:MAG: hypothetical protein Q9170_002683 [Blastenia crenularia]